MNNTLEYLKHLDWERFAFALFLLLFGYFFALSLKYCIGQKMI
ncbi:MULTISPECIES: hypothetical protein [Legionella]|nr:MULTISPECIES: hypothetical protein [unclassified Legionella]QLZ69986.1 hypothetical protein FOLKNPGA_02786 [Legionella sp. PC1000]